MVLQNRGRRKILVEGMNVRPRSLRPVDEGLDTGGAGAGLGLEFS